MLFKSPSVSTLQLLGIASKLNGSHMSIMTFNFNRIDRVCSRTTNVKGVTIPQGSVVVISIALLHHDPQYWKDPEKFDPDRYHAYSNFSDR